MPVYSIWSPFRFSEIPDKTLSRHVRKSWAWPRNCSLRHRFGKRVPSCPTSLHFDLNPQKNEFSYSSRPYVRTSALNRPGSFCVPLYGISSRTLQTPYNFPMTTSFNSVFFLKMARIGTMENIGF